MLMMEKIPFFRLKWSKSKSFFQTKTFSSPEAALLLVSTKNRDLWPGPTPEVCDSQTSRHSAHAQSQVWQIWLVLVSIYCVYKAIQKRNVVGPGQRSRFLVLTKRSAASGDENADQNRSKPILLGAGLTYLYSPDKAVPPSRTIQHFEPTLGKRRTHVIPPGMDVDEPISYRRTSPF